MIKAVLLITSAIVLFLLSEKATTYAYDLYLKGKASESWVAVEATVEKFKHRKSATGTTGANRGRSGQVSNPHFDVLYHYAYDGVDYSGDITGFGPYNTGQLKRPGRGRRATVYVNPENPSQSVYVKGVSKPNLGFLALGIGMGLVGLFLGFSGLKNVWKVCQGS